ncbi:helix-turn-helix domain-containing protein [Roseobacter sp. N2S]|uniref:helix-turn-helix domain-containing protein n=1 Tax=Roseobacter sp. N2S TaxID=2663844 RepID=UPI002862E407|nr:helix-turn-helix domain-containing protein [Roseobacter sp. N2S]MDR6264214.1 excisionase family DNA binding protein [Roseobacter sp. N2S]
MSIEAAIKLAVEAAIAPMNQELKALRKLLEGPKKPLTTAEKAEQLGVSEETIRRRVRDGKLKCASRNGNRMLFDA